MLTASSFVLIGPDTYVSPDLGAVYEEALSTTRKAYASYFDADVAARVCNTPDARRAASEARSAWLDAKKVSLVALRAAVDTEIYIAVVKATAVDSMSHDDAVARAARRSDAYCNAAVEAAETEMSRVAGEAHGAALAFRDVDATANVPSHVLDAVSATAVRFASIATDSASIAARCASDSAITAELYASMSDTPEVREAADAARAASRRADARLDMAILALMAALDASAAARAAADFA